LGTRKKVLITIVAALPVLGIAAEIGYAWLVAGSLINAPLAERPDFCSTGTYFCEVDRLAELDLEPQSIRC
jgi:hypothetical protein